MTTRTGGRRGQWRTIPVMVGEVGLASHYLLLKVERDAGINAHDELFIGAPGGMRDTSRPEGSLRGRRVVKARVLPGRVRRWCTAVCVWNR